VLSLVGPIPVLLRPGVITQSQLEDVIGGIEIGEGAPEGPHSSPGLHAKHYSPLTPLFLLPSGAALPQRGRGVYLWINELRAASQTEQMPVDAAQYAAILYDTLHQVDERGFDWIAVEQPPEWPEWAGVIDRLRRASS
jgi:L-threonylcarbamoyladenylate synthase